MEIQGKLDQGWVLFSLLSVTFYLCLVVMTSYPTLITKRPYDIPLALLFLILTPILYYNIFQILSKRNAIHSMLMEQDLLTLRSMALTERLCDIKEAEERIRIEHHDIRHKLGALAVMLSQGEYDEAKSFIDSACAAMDEVVPEKYCKDPILNAVFAFLINSAKKKGIPIKVSLDIPEKLNVDINELSAVLANAIENAIIACSHLPEDKRYISIKCVSSPQFMFQLINPHDNVVKFDRDGYPSSDRAGHGFGTRSIRAFCQKNNAFSDFSTKEGIFYFRLVLPNNK